MAVCSATSDQGMTGDHMPWSGASGWMVRFITRGSWTGVGATGNTAAWACGAQLVSTVASRRRRRKGDR